MGNSERKFVVRPVTSKVKNAIFSIIIGKDIEKKKVLDLFSGLGNFGIECLRRGSDEVFFVEINRNYCEKIKNKLHKEGFENKGKVITGDARKWVNIIAKNGEKFDLVFIDAPYGTGLGRKILEKKEILKILKTNSLIILREFWRESKEEFPEYVRVKDKRKYGEAVITFLTLAQRVVK